jgi:hypothetical protein
MLEKQPQVSYSGSEPIDRDDNYKTEE